jgi:hypothetical protein
MTGPSPAVPSAPGATGAAPDAGVVRYVPGAGVVVVRGGIVVALPDAPLDAAAAVWRGLDGAPGIMDVLQVLGTAFDTSLAALPAFAAVVGAGDRTHVLVRGGLEVTIATGAVDAGPLTLDGHDVTTWVERTVTGVSGVVVRLASDVLSASDAAVADSLLPFAGGVVRADAIVLGTLAQAAVPEAPAAPDPEPEASIEWPIPIWAPTPVAAPGPAAPAAPAAPLSAVPVPPPPAVPDVPAAAAGAELASPETLADLGTIVPSAFAPGDGEQVTAVSETASGAETKTGTEAETGPAVEGDQPIGDDYGSLWETTIHRSVEEAAVRLFEEEGAEAPSGLIAGVPQDFSAVGTAEKPAPESPAPAAPSPAASADGVDHDGHTVASSALADLRAVAAAASQAASGTPGAGTDRSAGPSGTDAAAAPVGPSILARACVAGHANPPSRDRCSVCGAAVTGDTTTLPRPALGRVRVSNGQVLELDRPLVVGRRPRSPKGASGQGADGAALHRIVTVPSPQQDVSRSHVEVRLEGWHVLAVDLSTTNGTTLLRAGQAPLRMHPGEPVLVVSGDVVDLGDEATLTFEDLP